MPPRQAKPGPWPPTFRAAAMDAWWLRWLGMALLGVIAYYPALHGGFLWDDSAHVTKPELRSLAGLARIWFELGATQQYYPVLHSAFWLEHGLWGESSTAYHWLNLLLHLAAAGLVVRVAQRLAIPGAWLAGLIFALHPVCVESVAWISEQKNTLSTVFYLLALLAYLHFDEARAAGMPASGRTGRYYALATLWFVLAILTKSVTATLPAALLVLAWWRRGQISWRRDVGPLLPWFVLGIAAGLCTAWVERTYIGAEGIAYDLNFLQRCLLAGHVLWFYLGKLLWPVDLSFVYPRWSIDAAQAGSYVPILAAIVVVIGLWRLRCRTRGPLAGALFFAGTLFPALGFFNVFPFIYSYVADHFQYLACLGIIVPVSASLTRLLTSRPDQDRAGNPAAGRAFFSALALAKVERPKSVSPVEDKPRPPISFHLPQWLCHVIPIVLVGGLGLLTWNQTHDYRDNVTLYRATLARNPSAWMASYNLGMELVARGETAAAIASYREALHLRPDYAEAHANLAMALLTLPERKDEAIGHLETAVRLRPELWQAECNLANTLLSVPGRQEEAIRHYKTVLSSRPELAEIQMNLGVALLSSSGRETEAIAHLESAVRTDPDLWQAHFVLANVLIRLPDRQSEAIPHLAAVLRIKPDYQPAQQLLRQLR
ncbi:MAG: tetratricopeptide repeat protein [Opitutaceae bacterium]